MSAFNDRKKPFSECIEIYLSEHTRLKGRASSKRHSSGVLYGVLSIKRWPCAALECVWVYVCTCNRSQPQPTILNPLSTILCTTTGAIQIALVVASIRIEIQSRTRPGIQLNAYRARCSCFEPNEAQQRIGLGWKAKWGRGVKCRCCNSIRQQWKRSQVYGNSLKTFSARNLQKNFCRQMGKRFRENE